MIVSAPYAASVEYAVVAFVGSVVDVAAPVVGISFDWLAVWPFADVAGPAVPGVFGVVDFV